MKSLKDRLVSDYGFPVSLKYSDPDGDLITLESDNDFKDLIRLNSGTVKVYVSKTEQANHVATILNSQTPMESGILKLNPLRVNLPRPAPRVPSANINKSKPIHIKWQKAELLGTGATGNVYLAFSLPNGKMMAVKQMDVTDLDEHQRVYETNIFLFFFKIDFIGERNYFINEI